LDFSQGQSLQCETSQHSGQTTLIASFRTLDCGITRQTGAEIQQFQSSRIFGSGSQIFVLQSFNQDIQKIRGIASEGDVRANANEEAQAEWL
jgi:hypothetical protein